MWLKSRLARGADALRAAAAGARRAVAPTLAAGLATTLVALVALVASLTTANARAAEPASRPPVTDTMAQRMQACTPCHGAEGRASADGYYPRIAGKPAGYLYEQLRSFRDGRRNQAAMSGLLTHLSDDYLMAMARYFADLELPYPAPAPPTVGKAILSRGEQLVRHGDPAAGLPACIGCHGDAMTGREPGTPGLLGLPRDYLVAQIGAWQTGQRRGIAPDCMARVAHELKPEDVLAVTSWLAAQRVPAGAKAVPDDGRELPYACAPVGAPDPATAELTSRADGPRETAAGPVATPEQVARGAYLAQIGNCIGCHTARGGIPFAGGRGIETPFGVIYAGNLTHDPATGLGDWTAADFRRALHEGRSRDGRLLYPAFPYPNYTLVSEADADALFAFFQSLPAVAAPQRAHSLRFPFDTQVALQAWRALYFTPATWQPREDRDAAWNRGDYLIRGLGHCDACHSPRNLLGAVRSNAVLAGGEMPGQHWYAPSLTSNAEAGVGDWAIGDIVALLGNGVSRHGSTIGPMADVVATSTRYLDEADLVAIATRLKTLGAPGTADIASEPSRADAGPRQRGAVLYREHCADCHGDDGAGVAGIYPPLAGNRAVTLPVPTNLVRIVSDGGFPPSTKDNPEPFGMPPFSQRLQAADIADVITYIRQAWGNQAAGVTAHDVTRSRP